MKRSFALLLALTLLCGLAAGAAADELPYIRQIPQSAFEGACFLTPESCPRVCLSPYYFESVYWYGTNEPWYIVFDAPADTSALAFSPTSCSFGNEERQCRYDYEATAGYTYTAFLKLCKDDDNIIFDGEGNRAAYIDPDELCAYGLVGMPNSDKAFKVSISIYMGNLYQSIAASALTQAIVAEIDRVQAQMEVQFRTEHWTDGVFAGVKMLAGQGGSRLLRFSMPELTVETAKAGTATRQMIVTSMDYGALTGYFVFGSYLGIEVEIAITDNNPAAEWWKKSLDDCSTATLADGGRWDIYMSGLKQYGQSFQASASRMLLRNTNDPCSVVISFKGQGIKWHSISEFTSVLRAFVSGMQVVSLEDDPYVPAAMSAPLPEPNAVQTDARGLLSVLARTQGGSDSGTWTCPNCGAESTGNFCANCGTGKPGNDGTWLCSNCQTENTGNFCTNCGEKKPEDDGAWVCPSCQVRNTGNFCANCGAKKP